MIPCASWVSCAGRGACWFCNVLVREHERALHLRSRRKSREVAIHSACRGREDIASATVLLYTLKMQVLPHLQLENGCIYCSTMMGTRHCTAVVSALYMFCTLEWMRPITRREIVGNR